MGVRAKMRCESVTNRVNGSDILLQPVTGGSKENESFYKYTPGGKIELSTVNPEAAKGFVPGQEYYVDFTPATGSGEQKS